jgi:hypothetical protein
MKSLNIKKIRCIYIFLIVFLFSMNTNVYAETLKSLQAKLSSMEACRQSLNNEKCNLKILDPDVRETLIKLDQLRSKQPNTSTKQISGGNVQFFNDSIITVNSNIIKLMGGSTWKLDQNYFGLSLEDLIGIQTGPKTSTLYIDGNTYSAVKISGSVLYLSGILTNVVSIKSEGKYLKLGNGMILEFDSYDMYDTGWWLPPYQVLIETSGMNMWNLNKGKKVWIHSIQ